MESGIERQSELSVNFLKPSGVRITEVLKESQDSAALT